MKTKVLIILIILVGLGAGGFFVYKNISVSEKEIEKEAFPVTEEKIEKEREGKEREMVAPAEEELPQKEISQEEIAPEEITDEEEVETPAEELPGIDEPKKIESDGKIKEEQIAIKVVRDLVFLKKEGYIIEGTSSCTVRVGNEYWMYIGTQLFVSQDDLNFEEKEKGALIYDETLDRIGNPTVIKLKDGRYRMFYEGEKFFEQKQERKLYSAVSFDGINWEKEGLRYEDAGDSGKPGEIMVSVPEVVEIDDKFYLYYTRGRTLALAVSEDEGMTWRKIKDILFEGIEIAMDPDLIEVEGGYKLFFTTADNPDLLKATKTWITDASSWDGINFEFSGSFKLEPDPGMHTAADADVVYLGEGKYRMYYGQAVEHFGVDYSLYSALLEEKK